MNWIFLECSSCGSFAEPLEDTLRVSIDQFYLEIEWTCKFCGVGQKRKFRLLEISEKYD